MYALTCDKSYSGRKINEICKLEIQHEIATIQLSRCSKCCPTLVANAHPQPLAPPIDSLVDYAVLQLSPDGDEALH